MMEKRVYPEREKQWVFRMLIAVAGFYGGYAMLVRGGAFRNVQTGNLALCALALGAGNWGQAAYYLVPFTAYLLGSIASELLLKYTQRPGRIGWSTVLILIEIGAVSVMGFIPASAPHRICQVIINAICAMQFTTFRQAEGIGLSTTFCTNHMRQMGIALAGLISGNSKAESLRIAGANGIMLLCFMVGAAAAAVICRFMGVKAIWCVLLPLVILFAALLKADLKEKAAIQ
mgnify:CR=1 FL=1